MSLKNLTETGETIVEVLIVTLILTSVMATSFALTTRTLNQDRASQERSEAAGYAQSQIERLSVAVRDGTVQDPVLVPAQPANFCLVDSASPIVSVSDINNVPAQCQSNRYSGYISYDGVTKTFTEKVVWENAVGNGKDNISLVYRPEFSQGSTTSTAAFTIPSPPPLPPPATPTILEAVSFDSFSGGVFPTGGGDVVFASNGSITKTVPVPAFSKISVLARGDQHPAGPPRMVVSIDSTTVIDTDVPNTSYQPYTTSAIYPAGTYTFRISFGNDLCGPPCGSGNPDRNLYVDSITLSPF